MALVIRWRNAMCASATADEPTDLPVSYTLRPDLLVEPAALIAAYHYVLAERQERTTPADAATNVQADRLKKDVAALTKALTALQHGYTITTDGSLTITGSSGTAYTVGTNGVCRLAQSTTLCQGWKAAQKTRSSCYHVWAMEILLTAQAFMGS